VKLRRLALAAGLILFAWLLYRIGLGVIADSLKRVGWGFIAVLALETVVVLFTTLGWRQTLSRPGLVPLRALLGMRLAGDGVNALAPAAVVGGELVRAGLLSRYMPAAQALGSVGLAAMSQFLGQVLFLGVGAILVRGGTLQPRLRLLGLALLAFFVIFVTVLRWIARRPRDTPGRFGRLRTWLARVLPGRFLREGFGRDLEEQVFGAVRDRPGRLALSVLSFFAAWLVGVGEVVLVLFLLGAPVAAATALSIAVLAVLVEGVLFFVPARVGVQEGGLYAIFLALGLDPVLGFTLGLVRRLRELTWGLAGLLVLGFLRGRREGAAAPDTSAIPSEPALGGGSAAR
jgi:uncharacterized protein (TIRG00374 family)